MNDYTYRLMLEQLLEDAIKGVLVAGVSASLVYGYRAHNRQQEMLERELARASPRQ